MNKKIVIIGGGAVGCAVARLLSAYEADILVLEAGCDVAEGASRANSGIVHGGYDAVPGTLKAAMNIRGTAMYRELCRELSVPYKNNGSMVLCFSEEDRPGIEKLYRQGLTNGVPGLRIIERDEVLALEPAANPAVVCALLVTNSGIVSPYELTFALADHAAVNGVKFRMNSRVVKVTRKQGTSAPVAESSALAQDPTAPAPGFTLTLSDGSHLTCDILINCAGTGSADIHNQLSTRPLEIIPRRGQYYLLDHQVKCPFTHTMFQLPTALGKGILVTPTAHGNIMLGPTAETITDPEDKETTAEGLAQICRQAALTWPGMNLRGVITTFAGIRAHEKDGDFIIGQMEEAPGAYETVGIESPGLSSAPAIAEHLTQLIAADQGLMKKERWLPAPRRPKAFYDMNNEERAEAVRQDPEYGALVCRCEEVTEAEIRAAIRRPVGAATIDGVKRRTRAGMGRCQGGFCSPRVLEILSEELGISPLEVTKCGPGSRLLTGRIGSNVSAAGKEQHHEQA